MMVGCWGVCEGVLEGVKGVGGCEGDVMGW